MGTQQEEIGAAAQRSADDAAKQARAAVKAQAVADQERRADEAARSTPVRAIRVGFYPADGCIRTPGAKDGSDYFDYVRRKDPVTGELETELPSWMQSVTGEFPTRPEFVPKAEQPVVIEVTGKGDEATIRRKR